MSRITKVTPLTERFAAALRRGAPTIHTATVNLTRYPGLENRTTPARDCQTVPATSAPLPRVAFNPRPEVTPAHGARRSNQRYREDYAADGCAFSEVHDTVGLGVSRTDPYGAALLAKAGRDNYVEYAGMKTRPDRAVDILQMLLAADAVDPKTDRAVRKAPVLSNRELLQRTSKRERLILKAFKLVLAGHSWDAAAKQLGITREEAREIRCFVTSRLGRAFSKRPRKQTRDHVGRFIKQKTSVTLSK